MIRYFENQLAIIYETFKNLPVEDFNALADRCAGILKNGGKIIASGLGKNVPICEKFVGTMNSLGLDARFLHTNTAVHGDLGIVRPEDLVLMLSKSGNTEESIILGRYLLNRGTETWCLTFNGESRLVTMFKKNLIMSLKNEGDLWDIIPNNSTTVYLVLLQGLAMKIAETLGVRLHDFKINHPGGGIGEKLRLSQKPVSNIKELCGDEN
jgi:arabinose-5-phosphate isomerase